MYNRGDGIYLYGITKSNINITTASHNDLTGMVLLKTNNTCIVETTAVYNNKHGIHIIDINHTHIANVIVTHNSDSGIALEEAGNICIRNLILKYNIWDGMFLSAISHSNITGIIALYNGGNGFAVFDSRNTNIMDTSIQNNNNRSTTFSEEYSLKVGYFFKTNEQISVWSSTEIIIQEFIC